MLCGIGFDAKVAHEFARQKKRGLQTYVRVSLAHFFTSRPYSFRIRLTLPEGRKAVFPVDAFFINIANGNQFGNHVTIAPKASLQDGMLDIVVVKRMWKLPMVFAVIRQVLGKSVIEDAASRNGTLVNGRRVQRDGHVKTNHWRGAAKLMRPETGRIHGEIGRSYQ